MSAGELIPDAPPGYEPAKGRGVFSNHNGPYFHKAGEGPLSEEAFFALGRHCNAAGLVHGGMLSAFMDSVMAGAVRRGTGKVGVTIHLSIDFLTMARAGVWVMGEGRLIRATRDVAFVDGRAYVGDHDVVRASGIFKLMDRTRGA